LPLTGHGNQDQRREGGTTHSSDAIVPARTPKVISRAAGGPDHTWPDHRRVFSETFAASGGFLLGRRTHEIFASCWPTMEDPNDDVARVLNDLPKYVVSSTLEGAARPRTTIIRDAAVEIRRLKESPGKPLRVIGSARLVQSWTDSISLTSISFGFIPSCSVTANASCRERLQA
jgi:dihydrofolate reductase